MKIMIIDIFKIILIGGLLNIMLLFVSKDFFTKKEVIIISFFIPLIVTILFSIESVSNLIYLLNIIVYANISKTEELISICSWVLFVLGSGWFFIRKGVEEYFNAIFSDKVIIPTKETK